MIEEAIALNNHFGTEIKFEVGDATKLIYPNSNFDSVIFSFNGLMSIPGKVYRRKAILEINRVLKEGGIFIFTTHDRDNEEKFLKFWKEELERWETGNQNSKLHEFGDLITISKNEKRDIYIHIPNKQEIWDLLTNNGFEILSTFYRSDKFNESEDIKIKSGECRFWVVKKITTNN